MKKIVGILVVTLMIAAVVFPVTGTMNVSENQVEKKNKIEVVKKEIQNEIFDPIQVEKQNKQIDTTVIHQMDYQYGSSLFYQRPYRPYEEWRFLTSATNLDYLCQDDFWDLSEPIYDIHWWGTSLLWDSGWYCCDPDGMNFEIIFYEDPEGAPGYPVCTYTLDSDDYTCEYYDEYNSYDAYHWTACLNPCCELSDGWVSVQSTDSPNDCSFLWLASPDGNQNALSNGEQINGNLSFELTGAPMLPLVEIVFPADGDIVTGNAGIEVEQRNTNIESSDINYVLFEYKLEDSETWVEIDTTTEPDGLMTIPPHDYDTWSIIWDTEAIDYSGICYIRATIVTVDCGYGYDTCSVYINRAPHALAVATVDYETMIVYFDGTESFDDDGYITNWIWDLGDGTTATGATIEHIYEDPELDYFVVLTVEDNYQYYGSSYYLFNYEIGGLVNATCNCEVKSIDIRHQGKALGRDGDATKPPHWPSFTRNGDTWDGETLGPVQTGGRFHAFAFEIVAEIEGDMNCIQNQRQEAKITWRYRSGGRWVTVNLTHNGRQYPYDSTCNLPFGLDGYTTTYDWKVHTGNKIIWADAPGLYHRPGGHPNGESMKAYFKATIICHNGNGKEITFRIEYESPNAPGIVPGSIKKRDVTKESVDVSYDEAGGIQVDPMTVTQTIGNYVAWHLKAGGKAKYIEIIFDADQNKNPFGVNYEVKLRGEACEHIIAPMLKKVGLFKYTIKVYDKDNKLLKTLDPWVEVENSPPNKPATPDGPTSGKTGVEYPYTTLTTDPDGHYLQYGWDWNGDGIVDEWDDNNGNYYDSGVAITTSHSWSTQGTYNVKVKAEDIYGAQSIWSDPLTVTMPRNKQYINRPFLNFLEQHPNLFPILQKLLLQRLGLQ